MYYYYYITATFSHGHLRPGLTTGWSQDESWLWLMVKRCISQYKENGRWLSEYCMKRRYFTCSWASVVHVAFAMVALGLCTWMVVLDQRDSFWNGLVRSYVLAVGCYVKTSQHAKSLSEIDVTFVPTSRGPVVNMARWWSFCTLSLATSIKKISHIFLRSSFA